MILHVPNPYVSADADASGSATVSGVGASATVEETVFGDPVAETTVGYYNATAIGWDNNPSNAVNGQTSTYASTSTQGQTLTLTGGTNASGSGYISKVEGRVYGYTDDSCVVTFQAYLDSTSHDIGTVNLPASAGWTGYVELDTPRGGWDWNHIDTLIRAKAVHSESGTGSRRRR